MSLTKADRTRLKSEALAFFKRAGFYRGAPKTIFTEVTHCARSGMSRHVKVYFAPRAGEIEDITFYVAHAAGMRLTTKGDRAIVVGGCGFNACLEVADVLCYALHEGTRTLQQWNYPHAPALGHKPVGLIWRDL